MGCPQWKEEVTAESVEGGLIGAVSEAEVVTAAASEGAEEATGEETVEDMALERWTQGVTTDRSGGAVRTRSSVVGQPLSTLRPAQTFTFLYNSVNFDPLNSVCRQCDYPCGLCLL